MNISTTSIKPLQLQGMSPLLQVYDMPTALQFYRDVLGLHVVSSSGEGEDADWVLLKYGDIELMLNTLYEKPARPAKRDLERQSVHQDVIIYFGCPDIDSTYQYLTEKGIELKEPYITSYGWKAIDFKDPDGYAICIHWPLEEDERPAK